MAGAARVTVYVDGSTSTTVARSESSLKWLDLCARADDTARSDRQRLYLKAIETLPNVSIRYGHFSTNPTRKALVRPAPGGPRTVEVWKTEEKGSDVNLAMFLLLDGVDGLYDEAIVISGDSDLVGPVREANRRFAPVHVLNPRSVHRDLARAATSYGPLDPALVAASQLPATVALPTGRTITRPAQYR